MNARGDMSSAFRRQSSILLLMGFSLPMNVAAQSIHDTTSPGRVRFADQVFYEFEVEKPVRETTNSSRPQNSAALRKLGLSGQVYAEFVVDTLGRAVPESLRILFSSHPLLSQVIRTSLENLRFECAEKGGRKVRQMVRQRFVLE